MAVVRCLAAAWYSGERTMPMNDRMGPSNEKFSCERTLGASSWLGVARAIWRSYATGTDPVAFDTPADTRRAIADGVQCAIVEAIGVAESDRRPAEAPIANPTYLGTNRQNVLFVQMTFVRGRGAQAKAALFAAIR